MDYSPLFHSYDNVLITDAIDSSDLTPYPTSGAGPWTGLYVVQNEPQDFYDYVSYYVGTSSSSTPPNVYTAVLNGQNNTVNNQVMHVPDLRTGGSGDSFNVVNEYWLQQDSDNVRCQVTLNGINVFQLKGDQTDLTLANSGTGMYARRPLFAYGSDFVPTLTVTNITTSPALTLLVNGRNQGIQLRGFTYRLQPLTDALAQAYYSLSAAQVFQKRAYRSITITPNKNQQS
jgi:hypothetical protein